ncbi:MAG: Hsp20/alpha crystallin family protein [Nitrosomonadales bacterium]|nr:Hsp20/alpha crystallin family protein [Nitrosomonadales bacterium]
MVNLLRYNPADNTFDDLFRGFLMRPVRMDSAQEMQIKLDVSEDDKSYTVHAEIPGVKKEDIHVTIDGNQVSISAEVKNEKDVKEGDKVLRNERYYGKISRVFTLAQDVESELSAAKYNNGVLELTLPKKATATTKRLTIN